MDNGPELTNHALADWARSGSVGCVHIEPGAPWQNGIVGDPGGGAQPDDLNHEWAGDEGS